MSKALFLRLLDTPISEKGDRLRQQIADFNIGQNIEDVFFVEIESFSVIPSNPFAYWFDDNLLHKFNEFEPLESNGRIVRVGLQASDDFRFIRCWWEVASNSIASNREQTKLGYRWVPFAKGGAYSPYYSDLHLLVDWNNDGEVTRESGSAFIRNENQYFSPGFTYPRRPHKRVSVRILPRGAIFSVNGPSIFWEKEIDARLLALLNSALIEVLLKAAMGRGSSESSGQTMTVEAGFFQKIPICDLNSFDEKLVWEAYKWVRQPSINDETAHVFCVPALLHVSDGGLQERLAFISQSEIERQSALANLQEKIDTRVAETYGVSGLASNTEQTSDKSEQTNLNENIGIPIDEEDDEGEVTSLISESYTLISNLLMWCVGVAFGRWDVRYTLHPETLPALPEPFDPLPVCSPGMLKGANGLPLEDSPQGYPLFVAWRGYLVDDPDRPQDDIVHAVRAVLHLLWGNQAEAVEKEACQILQVPDLRAWFRDPKGFFAWHIKRYSKSRRKAPLYWLAQSAKKNFAIWLYYPRLNPDSLYFAAREYGDAKLNFETAHLEDQQAQLRALGGSNPKAQEKKIAVQTALVAELQTFLKKLDSAALLSLKPDLNDGVLLNLASLREIVPWKEPARVWDELLRGKYEWSAIAAQLRQKGLVKKA